MPFPPSCGKTFLKSSCSGKGINLIIIIHFLNLSMAPEAHWPKLCSDERKEQGARSTTICPRIFVWGEMIERDQKPGQALPMASRRRESTAVTVGTPWPLWEGKFYVNWKMSNNRETRYGLPGVCDIIMNFALGRGSQPYLDSHLGPGDTGRCTRDLGTS